MVCVLEEKLQKCKECFQKSYGQDLERLTVVRVSFFELMVIYKHYSFCHLQQSFDFLIKFWIFIQSALLSIEGKPMPKRE